MAVLECKDLSKHYGNAPAQVECRGNPFAKAKREKVKKAPEQDALEQQEEQVAGKGRGQWHEADQGKCAFRGDRHYL